MFAILHRLGPPFFLLFLTDLVHSLLIFLPRSSSPILCFSQIILPLLSCSYRFLSTLFPILCSHVQSKVVLFISFIIFIMVLLLDFLPLLATISFTVLFLLSPQPHCLPSLFSCNEKVKDKHYRLTFRTIGHGTSDQTFVLPSQTSTTVIAKRLEL